MPMDIQDVFFDRENLQFAISFCKKFLDRLDSCIRKRERLDRIHKERTCKRDCMDAECPKIELEIIKHHLMTFIRAFEVSLILTIGYEFNKKMLVNSVRDSTDVTLKIIIPLEKCYNDHFKPR